jgi:large subunit ribosomal protein L29
MANNKANKNEDLKDIQLDSLKGKIVEEQLRLKKLTFAHAMTPLENPMTIRVVRRGIARLQTELSSRK